jgi:hypothetical protein
VPSPDQRRRVLTCPHIAFAYSRGKLHRSLNERILSIKPELCAYVKEKSNSGARNVAILIIRDAAFNRVRRTRAGRRVCNGPRPKQGGIMTRSSPGFGFVFSESSLALLAITLN